MANTKISALPAGAPALLSDLLPIDRSGSNFSLQVQDILTNALAYPNLTVAGVTGISYDKGFVTNSVIGDNPLYTVPAGKRAIVLVSFYNTNGSTATIFPEVNPNTGTYYHLQAAISLNTNVGNMSVYGSFVYEANDVIAFNSSVTGVNAFALVILIPNTSRLRTVRQFATSWSTGIQTIYTATSNTIVSGFVLSASGGAYSNQSGSAATISSYVVPSGGTASSANQIQSNNNGTVANNTTSGPFAEGAMLKTGDFLAFATNQIGQQALLFNVYEGV